MTEKVEEVPSTRRAHKFYCDICKQKLMESEELDDGWYETPRCVDEEIFVHGVGKWYRYHSGHLCDECRARKVDEIVAGLAKIGFKEVKND